MHPLIRSSVLPVAVAAAVVLSACGAGAAASAPTAAPTAASKPAASAAAATAATTAPGASQASKKANANTASIPEIQAALEANGVTNAARWAREVDEYRPYPTSDPGFAKLRRELAKYNPGPETLERILATLAL